jgi:hypothetical protein
MSNITLLKRDIPVSSLYWLLQSNPQIWNQVQERTKDKTSPHHGLDDIWVRYGEVADVYTDAPHVSKWYPAEELLKVKPLCLNIMREYNGVELGGVLITRIPPGSICKPHKDLGWHARTYDKFALQITSAPNQLFCFENEQLETRPGDLYWFNNQEEHWVLNTTRYERITMIICIRIEK